MYREGIGEIQVIEDLPLTSENFDFHPKINWSSVSGWWYACQAYHEWINRWNDDSALPSSYPDVHAQRSRILISEVKESSWIVFWGSPIKQNVRRVASALTISPINFVVFSFSMLYMHVKLILRGLIDEWRFRLTLDLSERTCTVEVGPSLNVAVEPAVEPAPDSLKAVNQATRNMCCNPYHAWCAQFRTLTRLP